MLCHQFPTLPTTAKKEANIFRLHCEVVGITFKEKTKNSPIERVFTTCHPLNSINEVSYVSQCWNKQQTLIINMLTYFSFYILIIYISISIRYKLFLSPLFSYTKLIYDFITHLFCKLVLVSNYVF